MICKLYFYTEFTYFEPRFHDTNALGPSPLRYLLDATRWYLLNTWSCDSTVFGSPASHQWIGRFFIGSNERTPSEQASIVKTRLMLRSKIFFDVIDVNLVEAMTTKLVRFTRLVNPFECKFEAWHINAIRAAPPLLSIIPNSNRYKS